MCQSTASKARAALLACSLLGFSGVACGVEGGGAPPPHEEGLPPAAPPLPGTVVEADYRVDAPGAPSPGEGEGEGEGDGESEAPAPDPADPTVDCPRVRVVNTGADTLNVRPDPSTANAPLGVLYAGQIVEVVDVVQGQPVLDVETWYEIAFGDGSGFVSGAFSACVDPAAPAPEGFLLPFACGSEVTVTQGNNSAFSHNGSSAYAFDFGIGLDTPLLAVESGTVAYVDEDTQPGDPCFSGGGQSCGAEANYVIVDHGDGTGSLYAHVNSVEVVVGQQVARGQVVALSGGTGWSTGPHAHVQRQQMCGSPWCQSVPMAFSDVGGSGVPSAGDVVVSQNGCD